MVQERNVGMSVGMQSNITGGRKTCGNTIPLAVCWWRCE